MRIGPYELVNNLALAPMAGVTDLPFRLLCRRMGAGIAAGEMLTSATHLWRTPKSRRRMDRRGEAEPRIVQIVGGEPRMMAEAARRNVDTGAQIIDINMGCPAKKVCNKAAGSALMKDEALVRAILEAVVTAVDVPVTLKMRTGWDEANRNAVAIALMAEAIGVQALAVHGRTRACLYRGSAEYDTIRKVCRSVSIPVFANGDIDSPHKAKFVLEQTGAQGLMIGRAAQGRPWIFREIDTYLRTGVVLPEPSAAEVRDIMLAHLHDLHTFHGGAAGVRAARKHIDWYAKDRARTHVLRLAVMRAEDASGQLACAQAYFDALAAESAAQDRGGDRPGGH
ncbi:tRNA-dihydrouridine synthase B [Steroidobacter denitrificans]|uniref:tRNA-dihydrouridine synthase B n=1 Tax=Steroidobacter denitrificans TaxID=465721 RepID=A0A127FDR5_STEDE|nr:tRNA dihydrouridine synthase DusB [Steroidobacter denitrificans]AMN47831.1 tRNA-dihydrouridine synthase B [Steroidobacter denitrificans]